MAINKIENEKLTELKGFSALISDLFIDYDIFESGSALRENYEISEEELSNCVKKTLLEIKDPYFRLNQVPLNRILETSQFEIKYT